MPVALSSGGYGAGENPHKGKAEVERSQVLSVSR